MKYLLLLTALTCLAFTPPTSQNIIIITGTSTAIQSIGFDRQSNVNGNTNWCDVYYPFKLKDFSVAPPSGSVDISFTTNVLQYVNKGITNIVQPEWFTINEGETLAVEKTITKIYLKNGQYRIIGVIE